MPVLAFNADRPSFTNVGTSHSFEWQIWASPDHHHLLVAHLLVSCKQGATINRQIPGLPKVSPQLIPLNLFCQYSTGPPREGTQHFSLGSLHYLSLKTGKA